VSVSAPAPLTEDERQRAIRRVVLNILWLNLAVAVAKGIYAASSGSLAVASDTVHSVLDALSNVIGIVALRVAHSPPDAGHPYGHHKVEVLAAAGIGLFIAGATFKFAWSAVDALLHGSAPPEIGLAGLGLMGGTLLINLLVATYEHRRGRALQSRFLLADAAHTASDVAVTISVIIALVAVYLGVPWADPVAALGVVLVIGRVAWRILATNVDVLLDHAVVDATEVRRIASAVEGVAGCHRVRSRGVTEAFQIDLHLLIDGDPPLSEAHAISHRVEARLKESFAGLHDVTIHIEPEGDEEEDL
jgi:cation diffusion facilitator family transporter